MYSTSAIDIASQRSRKEIRRIAIGVVIAAGFLVAICGFANTASAGTYDVFSCRDASGLPLSTQAWRLDTYDEHGLAASDSCDAGGSLEIAIAPEKHGDAAGAYKFDAPAGTEIVDYSVLRSLETAGAGLPPLWRYEAFLRERIDSQNSEDYGCGSFGSDCANAGDPNDPFAEENLAEQHAPSLQSLQIWVRCSWEWCGAPEGVAARARLFRSQVTLSDVAAPSILATHGTLLDVPASGTATLRVGASDIGGGIAAASASIDGAPPQTWRAGDSFPNCNVPYSAARPCPLETEVSFAFDTSAFANGTHELSGTVTDAAGNVTPFGPVAITINNTPGGQAPPTVTGQGSSSNGSPAVATPVITLNPGSRIRKRGTKTAVSGTLKTQGGQPIDGASLSVSAVELATDDMKEKPLPNVVTGADGSFSVLVNSDGALLLRVAFAPSPGSANTAVASVAVRTSTAISLKASKSTLKRGHSVTLNGKLLGAGPSAHGSTVSIQAIVHGRWRPVGAARVGKSGGFKWSYKFVAVTRTTNFSFRAVIAKTPGWPWPTIASKRLHVKVKA